ncbi:unannotated protein [freshwater metagenome]|uniref:Unannotated protein n=1 Tax=freshwater metagenome TaxID=449393 RepID=A0A6J6UV06_9ZZZZ|nr:hypothetical protein [Actinomycetota bacterium]MSX45308.1 hypothetical protein [Actinomycetota bacterium]MSX73011.1 hypothetical protein [Actinomycetota bacterium]MSZ00943.1 hypothetical protein [Actinomycetota bacterium]MTA59455.1 hypothetical protein [Actinomycetota bacterium]
MRYLYSAAIGAGLGAGSVFIHASLVPFGLIFVLLATVAGVWSIGRMWGGKTLRVVASIAWTVVVLRAGFPGINDEYLIEGTSIGISLINVGFMALVLAILLPA